MPTVGGLTFSLAYLVRETTQTTSTGTYTLDGRQSGYRAMQEAFTSGTRVAYSCRLGSNYEEGIGTITAGAPATLSRDDVLTSSNNNNPVSWPPGVKDIFITPPAALLNQIYENPVADLKVTTFTAGGTFTTDAKCIRALVRMVGGGAGGGGCNSTGTGEVAESSGGGAGEYAEGSFSAAQLGTSKVVVIGGGGAGGNGQADGTAGGTTTFGGTLLTAIGGSGGGFGARTTGNATATAGVGGSGGTGGYLHVPGGNANRGRTVAGDVTLNGNGGDSVLGTGGVATTAQSGDNARGYGGGGGGVSNGANTGAKTAGSGSGGIVIVTEYLKP